MNIGKYTATGYRGAGALLAILLLASCSENDEMIALQDYVQSVVNRPPGRIEPIPQFKAYDAFTYSAANLRSPFDIPIDISVAIRNARNNQVKPDENRPREELENFALGALTMIGTLERNDQMWALIRDETSHVHRVTTGNYMGRNHGRIVGITETQIDIVEIVPTGDGGWIERPQNKLLGN
jgi:type IV pilus assembly protein PilP